MHRPGRSVCALEVRLVWQDCCRSEAGCSAFDAVARAQRQTEERHVAGLVGGLHMEFQVPEATGARVVARDVEMLTRVIAELRQQRDESTNLFDRESEAHTEPAVIPILDLGAHAITSWQ